MGFKKKTTSATNPSSSSNPHSISSLMTPSHSLCSFLTFFKTRSPDFVAAAVLFWGTFPLGVDAGWFGLLGSSGRGNLWLSFWIWLEEGTQFCWELYGSCDGEGMIGAVGELFIPIPVVVVIVEFILPLLPCKSLTDPNSFIQKSVRVPKSCWWVNLNWIRCKI